jgi:hypothetical protein
MTQITEVAPDLFRITTSLSRSICSSVSSSCGTRTLLFTPARRCCFRSEGGGSLIDPARLRWIAFSHFSR